MEEEVQVVDLTKEDISAKQELFRKLSYEHITQGCIDIALDNLHEGIAKFFDQIKFLKDSRHDSLEKRARVASNAPEFKKNCVLTQLSLLQMVKAIVNDRVLALNKRVESNFSLIEKYRKQFLLGRDTQLCIKISPMNTYSTDGNA